MRRKVLIICSHIGRCKRIQLHRFWRLVWNRICITNAVSLYPGFTGETEKNIVMNKEIWFLVKFLSFPLQIQRKIFLTCTRFVDKEKPFLLLLQLFWNMLQSDQQVVLLIFSYHFRPNVSLVLRMTFHARVYGVLVSPEKSYFFCACRSLLLLFRCSIMFTLCL